MGARPPSKKKKGCAAAALICSRLGISSSDAVCGCDAMQMSMYRCLRAAHETRIHKGSLVSGQVQVGGKNRVRIFEFSNRENVCLD